MKETKELPSFTASGRRAFILLMLLSLAGASIWTSGCAIKQNIKIPQAILNAKTASFDDLLGILRRGNEGITSLSCSDMELTFTSSNKRDNGELEKWRSVNGYILLKRPDSIHFVLLIPVTKSTFLDVLSVGDSLSVWYPRKNEFYRGKNSQRELIIEDSSGMREFTVPVRGTHLFEAICPQGVALDTPGVWISDEEQTDGHASYYVLSFLKEGTAPRIRMLRKIWIERAGLTIARHQVFGETGEIVSDIGYSDQVMTDGFMMPLSIHIDRPAEGYILDLKFKKWNVNPDLPEDAFQLKPPSGARSIILREKGR